MSILLVTFVSLTLWGIYIEGNGKYVLYSLPVTVFLSHLLFRWDHLEIERNGIIMLLAYVFIAAMAILNAGAFNMHTSRDILIIAGYLSFFLFRHRSPAIVPAASLAILFIAMVVEFSSQPIALTFDIFSSQGLAESSLAFPIGLLVIYFFHERRWLLLLLSALLFFAAFKRIALLAAIIVIFMHLAVRLFGRRSIPRAIAVLTVIVCSIVSLYTMELFQFAVSVISDTDVSQSSLSLGRSELAQGLWDQIHHGTTMNTLFGFGPGAADTVLLHVDGGPNPHNDWLKIYFDYGIAGFVTLHVILFLMHNRIGFAPMLYIYTAMVMMTDNVLLYMFHFIFVYLVLSTPATLHAGHQTYRRPVQTPDLREALLDYTNPQKY